MADRNDEKTDRDDHNQETPDSFPMQSTGVAVDLLMELGIWRDKQPRNLLSLQLNHPRNYLGHPRN